MKRITKRNITLTDSTFLFKLTLCALSNDVVLLAVDNAAPRALTLHTAHLAANDSVDFKTCAEWNLTRAPTRCCFSCQNRYFFSGIWCRWAASKVNGAKWGPHVRTKREIIPTGDFTLNVVYNVSVRCRSQCEPGAQCTSSYGLVF